MLYFVHSINGTLSTLYVLIGALVSAYLQARYHFDVSSIIPVVLIRSVVKMWTMRSLYVDLLRA